MGSVNLTVKDQATGVFIGGAVTRQGSEISFSPSIPLMNNRLYEVHASGTFSQKTGATASTNYRWTFRTIDPAASHIVYYNDFNNQATGTYTTRDLATYWPNSTAVVNIDKGTVSVDRGSNNQGNFLKILLAGDSHGYNGNGIPSGAQWMLPLGGHEELYISFWIKFSDNFDFSGGGKIPGFTGGNVVACQKPNGTDYFNGRMVYWSDSSLRQYLYYPGQTTPCGHGMAWTEDTTTSGKKIMASSVKGKWSRFETHIKLNSPGKYDDIIESWMDGKKVFYRNSMRFRTVNSLKIDKIMWGVSEGVRTSGTKHNQYMMFDEVILSTRPITH